MWAANITFTPPSPQLWGGEGGPAALKGDQVAQGINTHLIGQAADFLFDHFPDLLLVTRRAIGLGQFLD